MGTYGALYYASELSPGYVIVGKPLVNIGDIASNEELVRPGGFPTSLDILRSLSGSLSEEGVEILNQRFWASFEKSDFSNTRFIISYMKMMTTTKMPILILLWPYPIRTQQS